MKTRKITFASIPDWAVNAAPSALSFFEAIALSGLEGKWLRLSADTQRALLGFPVFGKREVKVVDGEVFIAESVCFGTDSNIGIFNVSDIKQAIEAKKTINV